MDLVPAVVAQVVSVGMGHLPFPEMVE